MDILNINAAGQKIGWDYSYNIGIKSTNDKRNDIKDLSLTNLSGIFKKKYNTISIGDIFESFSQYTLATALKGASYKFSNDNSKLPKVFLVFGNVSPRWDSLWKDSDTRTQKKQAYGARIKKDFLDSIELGINFLNSKDIDTYNSTTKYNVSNLGLDFSYKPMSTLNFNCEFASSDYDENISKSSDKGKAYRFEIFGDADPSRVSIEYENVSPDFLSPLGSSTPDRRKVKSKWRYKYSKYTTFNTGILWYRNNLDNQLTDTTYSWRPELSMSVKKIIPSRPYSFADFSYKFDRKYGSGSSQADHYFNINYRDKLKEIDSDTNLGYTIYKTKTAVRDSSEINFNTSLSSRLEKGSNVYTPKINLGAWYSKDELSNYSDKIYEYSLGLGFEKPQSKFSSEIRLGQNYLRKEDPNSDDSNKTFANISIYYKLNIMKTDSTLFVRAMYNDFNFSTNIKDFREKSLNFGINTSF